MDFDMWLNLSEDAREARIREWKQDKYGASTWRPLIEEVVRRFRKEYGGINGVNGVLTPVQSSGEQSLVIIVITDLNSPNRISNLPQKYFGFQIEQRPIGQEREQWVKTIVTILTEIARWSSEKAERWVEETLKAYLDGIQAFSYHDDPIHLVMPALVPNNLLDHKKRQAVESSIYKILARSGVHPDSDPQFDWPDARGQIEAILRQHGMHFPQNE